MERREEMLDRCCDAFYFPSDFTTAFIHIPPSYQVVFFALFQSFRPQEGHHAVHGCAVNAIDARKATSRLGNMCMQASCGAERRFHYGTLHKDMRSDVRVGYSGWTEQGHRRLGT